MHYAQANPSRSNLPRDPVTGRIKAGPGRRRGQPNVLNALAKDGINRVFEELGGVEGMYDWARSSPKNLTLFYTQIFPKLLAAQVLDAAAERLVSRPALTRIENVIIDPKNDCTIVLDEVLYRGEDEQVLDAEHGQVLRSEARCSGQ